MSPLGAPVGEVAPGGGALALAGREIVVGFDGSEASCTAVRWAAVEAARLGSPLTVVYAANVPVLAGWPAGGAELLTDLVDVSAQVAARGADLARQVHPGLAVRSRGVIGGPAAELIAESLDAALLVVGHQPRSALQAALGSVSFAVSLHARTPVVVVAEGHERHPGPEWPVVVGVDGSGSSEGALDHAARIAAAWQAPLRAVSTWTLPMTEPWTAAFGDAPEAEAVAEASAHQTEVVLGQAVERVRLHHPELAVSSDALEGEPDLHLVEASERAGLVVVGSRGHGGFAGMMLGSVSHSVLRQARSPVAVVRRGLA